MHPVLRNLAVSIALTGLWGCGASVDGGSGTVKEGTNLGTTVSLDQNAAAPGTNLVVTAEINNSGTDASSGGLLELITDGWPVVQTAQLGEVQFSCEVDGSGSCDNIRVENDIVIADLSLDPGATATFTGRLPLFYLSDSDASSVGVELCAADGPSTTADTDPEDNCDTAEASVSGAQTLVDFRDEVIYWAMTDRFFNGDPTNDNGNGDRAGDQADPSNPTGWHGGDFAGLKAKIEEGYYQAMGFTAIWISPVVLQQPAYQDDGNTAYHGYWLENYDDPEPHFGSWAELNDLVATAHANDLKILIDLVVNHAGYDAQIVTAEPDWFRNDIDACGSDDERITDCLAGLPDTRQEVDEARQWALDGARNILLQSGADGFRIDTYKHVNEDFWYDFFAPDGPGDRSTVWSIGEYFDLSTEAMAQALDRDGSPSIFDFPLYGAISDSIAARSRDMAAIAGVFENDAVYEDPTRLTTFIDNHDVDRFATVAISGGASTDEAEERLSMALGLLYASRGVPSVYYGTELAYQGLNDDKTNRRSMVFPEDAARLAKAGRGTFRKVTCGVTGTGDATEAYGVEFFVRGGFDGWADPPNATTAFANMGGNVYEAEFEIVAGDYEFKVASADWSTVDFTADGAIDLDAAVTLQPGAGLGNTAISIPADGCYNFRLDVTDTGAPVLTVNEVTDAGGKTECGVTGTGDPADAYGVEFFVRGGFDGWADPPNATTAFANMGGNVYEAEFEIVAGDYEFKVASADWSTVDFTADGAIGLDSAVTLLPGAGLGNTAITIPADGCYNFRLDVSNADAPVLTVTEVPLDTGGGKTECGVTGSGDPTEAYGAEFFIRGGFDDWADPPNAATAFANMGGNIYESEFEIVAGDYEFKVASADWSTVDFTADGAIDLDSSVSLLPGAGLGNTAISIPVDGCYNFRTDVTDTGAPVLVVTEVEIDGGGGQPPPDGGDVDLLERLTLLAAARESYPALRRGTQAVAYNPASACEPEETGNDPAEAFGVEMFARGSFNGWADPPPTSDAFANLGGDIYEARVQLAAGEQAYKVASADYDTSQWSYQDGTTTIGTEVVMVNADGEDTNGALTIDETGCYVWTMDASDTLAPTLTINQLFAGSGTDVLAIQRDMDGEASVVAVANNEDEDVDLTTLGDGGIPVTGIADGAVVEITGAETDLSVAGGLLIGTVPARTTYLVSDQ